MRLKALGSDSQARAVPRTKIPLRPESSLPPSLTPRTVLALEASIAQGNLRCQRLQKLCGKKTAKTDDASIEDKLARAQNLKELLCQISGSLTLGKAAEAEVLRFHKELHNIKVKLTKQEQRRQALAASNAGLKEANYIQRIQAGLAENSDDQGARRMAVVRSLTCLESSSASNAKKFNRTDGHKLHGKDARDVKLQKTLKRLEGRAGSIAHHASAAVDERRRLEEMRSKSQKGCGAYTGKCSRTATAEGLQRTLLELLQQRERVMQYRDDSIAMERETSQTVEALRHELNSVEW